MRMAIIPIPEVSSIVRTLTLVTLAFVLVAPSATAQQPEPDTLDARTAPSRLGGVLQVAGFVPIGEFRDNAGFGVAGIAGVRYFLDKRRFAALYGGFGFASFDSESMGDPLFYQHRTETGMYFVEVGPQIHLGRGPIAPYISASVGLTSFVTSTNVGGLFTEREGSTDLQDISPAFVGGGGLRIRVGSVHLDLAVTLHLNGTMTYRLGEDEFTSRADLLRFQAGVILDLAR